MQNITIPILNRPRLSWQEKPKAESFASKFIKTAKQYAGVIDSRESITRIALDLLAFDFPTILAAATRGWASLMEAIFEGGLGTTTLLIAPHVTKFMAKLSSKVFLDKEDQKHYDKLVRFYRHELHDKEGLSKGIRRILAEEPKDIERVAKVYESVDKKTKAENFQNKASELKDYFENTKISEEKLKKLINFKEAVISAESWFEGVLWGGFGLSLRWFRKNILGLDRFSGTNQYLKDKDAEKLGEAKPLNTFQKTMGLIASFMAPIYNIVFMKLCRNREAVKKNPFLNMVDKALDMTHGLYPKLGLLFSYTTVPKWFGNLCTVQGKDELIERLLKLCTVIPSWWLGHRVANGTMSTIQDKKLAEKHKVHPGILVEQKDLGKAFPEPAKIHHVLERTEGNKALQAEAKDKHANILYSGIGLHSLGVFLITMAINAFTKWRVKNKLQN